MTRLLSLALGRLLATTTLATAPVGYTLDDFDFIGAAAISQPGMVLRSEIPFQTMDDVLTAAAEGPVSYATQTILDRLTTRALEAAGQAEAFVTLTRETLRFPVRWIPGAELRGILETERDNFGPLVETFGEAN